MIGPTGRSEWCGEGNHATCPGWDLSPKQLLLNPRLYPPYRLKYLRAMLDPGSIELRHPIGQPCGCACHGNIQTP